MFWSIESTNNIYALTIVCMHTELAGLVQLFILDPNFISCYIIGHYLIEQSCYTFSTAKNIDLALMVDRLDMRPAAWKFSWQSNECVGPWRIFIDLVRKLLTVRAANYIYIFKIGRASCRERV